VYQTILRIDALQYHEETSKESAQTRSRIQQNAADPLTTPAPTPLSKSNPVPEANAEANGGIEDESPTQAVSFYDHWKSERSKMRSASSIERFQRTDLATHYWLILLPVGCQ
jgi:hypothetical protein